MLKIRVIPLLLLKGGGFYKTVRFANPTYLGDPINIVRIFNDKEVDEVFVADIGATSAGSGRARLRPRRFASCALRCRS
jgi:cyclase